MEKNNKFTTIFITAIILILLFGGILLIFNKKGFLSFKSNETRVSNDVNNTQKDTTENNDVNNTQKDTSNNDCFDTKISDYDTVQEINKFWNKLLGNWSNGFYGIKFSVNDGIPHIVAGKNYSEYSSGIIVSIKKEKDNIFTFNVVRPMSSGCDKEICEKNDTMKLYIDEWNIEFDSSYTIDVSNLNNGSINYIEQNMWDNDADAVFKRVNN